MLRGKLEMQLRAPAALWRTYFASCTGREKSGEGQGEDTRRRVSRRREESKLGPHKAASLV